MSLYKAYKKKLSLGDPELDPELEKQKTEKKEGVSSLITGLGSLGAGIIDSAGSGDPLTGRRSIGAYSAKGALKGAATGAQLAGPVGGIIGGVIGLGAGLLKGQSEKSRVQKEMRGENNRNYFANLNRSQAMLATNPEAAYGYEDVGYYADGGNMKSPLYNMHMKGGNAKSLSSTSVEFQGRDHEEGGIKIPKLNVEVEDNETTKGSFVFSDKLGFAKLHKPIAKAIGRIEKKPQTPERINSLRRLKGREDELAKQQEYLKRSLNLS